MRIILLTLFVLLTSVSYDSDAQSRRIFFVAGLPKPAEGGPDTWYDIQAVAGANNGVNAVLDEQLWATVTVGAAGTATKLRTSVNTFSLATGVKFGFYNNAGTLLSTASGTISGNGDDIEFSLSPTVAVTATTYKILVVSGLTGGFNYRFLTGTGTLNYTTTAGQYDLGAPDPLPSGSTVGWNICFGVYVD